MRRNVGGGSGIGVDDRLHKLAADVGTAIIHEVKFEKTLEPSDLTVHVGDEIRWVNHRTLLC